MTQNTYEEIMKLWELSPEQFEKISTETKRVLDKCVESNYSLNRVFDKVFPDLNNEQKLRLLVFHELLTNKPFGKMIDVLRKLKYG